MLDVLPVKHIKSPSMTEKIGIIIAKSPDQDNLELTVGTKDDAIQKELQGQVVGFRTSPAIRRELTKSGITADALRTEEPPEN